MTNADRLEIARLVHRFGFGPRPGEYLALVHGGVAHARREVLRSDRDAALAKVADPHITDLGPAPSDPAASNAYWQSVWDQYMVLATWWLDRMVLADHPLVERMTWFWHGHWATSIGKVGFALPMKIQNQTLRQRALGNFSDMAREMILDGALIYWLDGEVNVVGAPNENLGREFMELFTLGVGNFTEDDVKAAARGLTGYRVVETSGRVSFESARHDHSPVRLLGTTRSFDASSLSDFVVAHDATATHITNRLWFRFVSTTVPPPRRLVKTFAKRNIVSLVHAIATDPAVRRPGLSQVKSPVEWFVSACRALRVTPSRLDSGDLHWLLGQMGQFPFDPPSVGGWPFDEAWLTASSAQYRFSLADVLVHHGNVTPLGTTASTMVQAAADWLGVAQWSERTARSLRAAVSDPRQLATLAICAPEFVVSV